jgi:methylenetetrahydrofolate dehydrogenase (NADP+)/methenyltetrahydrofolate cyclohydrolase
MAQILDGKKLAEKILKEVKNETVGLEKPLRLAIVIVGEDPVVRKFVEQKKKKAKETGINIRIYPFPEAITTNELRRRLAEIVHEKNNHGVIVQLPLPTHLNGQYILNAVTPEKDVDMLSAKSLGNFVVGKSAIISPVAGAIKAFFEEYNIEYKNKHIVVAGAGNLVGRPVALWLFSEHASFSVINQDTPNPENFLRGSDIIISGIGRPKFITGDKVKEGVVVIDAGTSEAEGPSTELGVKKLVGDVDFESVSEKASYITPVPGGVGPVTIALLLKNLVTLAKQKK